MATQAQLKARAEFARRARAGTLRKGSKLNATKRRTNNVTKKNGKKTRRTKRTWSLLTYAVPVKIAVDVLMGRDPKAGIGVPSPLAPGLNWKQRLGTAGNILGAELVGVYPGLLPGQKPEIAARPALENIALAFAVKPAKKLVARTKVNALLRRVGSPVVV